MRVPGRRKSMCEKQETGPLRKQTVRNDENELFYVCRAMTGDGVGAHRRHIRKDFVAGLHCLTFQII